MAAIRVYADTSVYGGVFDAEFEKWSRPFFEQVRAGRFRLVVGAPVRDEVQGAPPAVRELYLTIAPLAEFLDVTPDALDLRDAYLEEDVVGAGSSVDALHVALATISRCEVIVSWNFKHIVHRDKAPRYNAVNVLRGHTPVGIFSPAEILKYE